ncbi:MAG: substrate-binding domain-containing protein [Alphaproteobacteria bacterium]|nr:substrate-binding domain-containing protein [Alphaproteobacteria bacterium]
MTRVAWLLAAGLFAAPPAWAADGAIHLRGSRALVPAAQRIAEAYMASHPGVTIVVRDGDSGPGLKGLLDGTVDIAMISAEIPAETAKRAQTLKISPHVEPVALDAVVPVVHPTNPVASLSMEQLGAIYGGARGEWLVLALPTNSGTAAAWRDAVLGDRIQTPKAEILAAKAMAAKVAAEPSAIGYLALGAVDSTVKALAIDGIAATPETIRAGGYPLRRQLALVTTESAGPAVRQFVAHFLSAEARAALGQTGLLPIK